MVGGPAAEALRQDVELLEGAGFPFELESYLQGKQTPVFFGSAVNNFGVRELLDIFVRYAPAPGQRSAQTRTVSSEEQELSGVVFKIQANMNPEHRDRIAFVRICSGQFQQGLLRNMGSRQVMSRLMSLPCVGSPQRTKKSLRN